MKTKLLLIIFVLSVSLSACGELGFDPYGNLNGQRPGTGDTGGDTGGGDVEVTNPEIFKPFAPELYYGRSKLTADEQKAYDVVLDTLLNYKGEISTDARMKIDLETSGINTINVKQITKILSVVMEDESRIFHLASNVPRPDAAGFSTQYVLTNKGGVSFFYARLLYTFATFESYKLEMNKIESKVKQILDTIKAKKATGYTDAQIAATIYEEYLAGVAYGGMSSAFAGSLQGSFANPNKEGRYLVVCEGYARTYLYLLQRMGIKSIYIGGAAFENGKGNILHAWNKVQIDGKWYNADPTWDDAMAVYDESGDGFNKKSDKDDFLKSDATFQAVHPGPNKDASGKPYGYASHGITLPASNLTDFPESGYAR